MDVFIVYSFCCGLVTAVIANNKGRGGFTWFLVGFVLGLLGIITSIVISKDDVVLSEKAISDGISKKCIFCAELIKSDAVLCKHCGKEQLTNNEKTEIKSSHSELQDAIYKKDIDKIHSLIRSGINLEDCDLAFSHLDYAKHYGDDKIVKVIEVALKS